MVRVMMFAIPCVVYRRANVLKDWNNYKEGGKRRIDSGCRSYNERAPDEFTRLATSAK
jgi:hypothetical protein